MVTHPSLLPVAVRAFPVVELSETARPMVKRKKSSRIEPRPSIAIVFDTECSTDRTLTMSGFEDPRWTGLAQSLLFGVARICRTSDWRSLEEFMFYPDDLPDVGLRTLSATFDAVTQPIADGRELRAEIGVRAHLIPLSEFLKVFFHLAYRKHALVVGFNLPFDLARLAYGWAPAKTQRYAGGWSLKLWRYQDKDSRRWRDHPFRPRVLIKPIDSKKAFMGFSGIKLGPEDGRTSRFRGHFLDLRTLAFALTAKSYSLKRACQEFAGFELDKDVEHGLITSDYVTYARSDVAATVALAKALLAQFDEHPVSIVNGGILRETKAFSTASIAKAYLRQMKIRPQTCSPEIAGLAASAYFGGWTETQVRLVDAPCVLLDFTSMYSTVNVLMQLWRYLITARVDFVDATDVVQSMLDTLKPDDLFNPQLWTQLPVLVRIEPDGDILPVRARFEPDRWSIGMVPYHAGSTWYMLPDIMASFLKTGRRPRISQALRMVPVGRQRGLKPIALYGRVSIDLYRDDLFKKNIEERVLVKRGRAPYADLPHDVRERTSLALKTFGNAGSYGINAEMNRTDLIGGRTKRVTLYSAEEPITLDLAHPEEPGPFAFMPLGALIPSAARLMLELAHWEVERRGGNVVFGDTDSLAPVATRDGGTMSIDGRDASGHAIPQSIVALSWDQIREIVSSFEQLNPYDRTKVPGSTLEIKEANFDPSTGEQIEIRALAVSAKRYALYRADGSIADRKESVLGMLLSPVEHAADDDTEDAGKDWITQVWSDLIPALAEGRMPEVSWLDVPAVRRLSLSSPTIMKQIDALNVVDGKRLPRASQIKPFNFFLVTTGRQLRSVDARSDSLYETIPLIAAFERDPSQWFTLAWTRTDNGERVALSREEYAFPQTGMPEAAIVPVTMFDFLSDYARHPEGDWLGPDGRLCTDRTRGVLQRRPVRKLSGAMLGKEGDVLTRDRDDVDSAFGTDDVEAHGVTGDPWRDAVLPCLRLFPVADVAARCHVDERTIKRWRTGNVRPDREEVVARQLARMAADWLSDLDGVTSDADRDVYSALRQFFERHQTMHQSLSRSVREHATNMGIRGFAEHLSIPFETVRSWVRVGIPMNPARLRSIHQLVAECRLIGAGDERR